MGLPVEPANDSECAAWLQESLDPWPNEDGGVDVASVVPQSFAAHAR